MKSQVQTTDSIKKFFWKYLKPKSKWTKDLLNDRWVWKSCLTECHQLPGYISWVVGTHWDNAVQTVLVFCFLLLANLREILLHALPSWHAASSRARECCCLTCQTQFMLHKIVEIFIVTDTMYGRFAEASLSQPDAFNEIDHRAAQRCKSSNRCGLVLGPGDLEDGI